MVMCLIMPAFAVSLLLCFTFLKAGGIFHDEPQKNHAIHKEPVPRIGGLAIFVPFALFGSFTSGQDFPFLHFLLPAGIVFAVGFLEDTVKGISPWLRLSAIIIASALAIFLLSVEITDIGIFKLPFPVSIIFTLIAIAGFTNAMNIIDGLNGLASGIAIVFLSTLGVTFLTCGEIWWATLCFLIVAGVAGFVPFNFPKAKIFLGDGGAYFLGFACVVLSIKLANTADVSPWFPLMLGAYPVWETLFSAYRRKRKGRHPLYPDRLHFHTLLYQRLTRSNARASFLIVTGVFVSSLLAYFLRTSTILLMAELFLFIVIYLKAYRYIVNFA